MHLILGHFADFALFKALELWLFIICFRYFQKSDLNKHWWHFAYVDCKNCQFLDLKNKALEVADYVVANIIGFYKIFIYRDLNWQREFIV